MEGSVTGMASLDFSPVITALTSAVTPANIISLVGSIVAFGIPFVFMWFGMRKVIKIFRSAVMGGRITV
ncbi:MAG: hypothetical protein HFJ23_05965 [Clostridia bacterium]|nr:hypothetical protein [Clostridia bacterium]